MNIKLAEIKLGNAGRYGISTIELEKKEQYSFTRSLFGIEYDLYSELLIIHLLFFGIEISRFYNKFWKEERDDTPNYFILNGRISIY